MRTSKRRGRPRHDDVLTPAEWRVVDAVRHGLTNREIAARRRISLDAVKFHVANALAKLGVANRRALKHWQGVPKDSPAKREIKVMPDAFKITAVGQISRTVSDIGQTEAWYRDVLGLEHLYTFDKLAFFDCGGTRLMLTERDLQPAESILYLRVPDIQAAHAALSARGVVFVGAPHMIHRHADGTEEWMAFFNDLEERPLAIMSSISPKRLPPDIDICTPNSSISSGSSVSRKR
jgi:DNA-binding CsgD family transcriptional regulator/catechol 2,3-dioxygenase-like lactoylglutathione lyase family enzyme